MSLEPTKCKSDFNNISQWLHNLERSRRFKSPDILRINAISDKSIVNMDIPHQKRKKSKISHTKNLSFLTS